MSEAVEPDLKSTSSHSPPPADKAVDIAQCSQRSRGLTGPGGRTAKSAGPDGTAENMPSSSAKSKDGRLSQGRRARQPETQICRVCMKTAGLLWEL